MRKEKVLSIVIATFNINSHIDAFIDSLSTINDCRVEVVVVDGFSKDGTVEILQEQTCIDVLIVEDDKGIYDALNKGISCSTGRYLYFIGADDKLISESLSVFVDWLEQLENIERLITLPVRVKNKVIHPIMSKPPIFHHQGVVFHHTIRSNKHMYSLDYKIHSDYDLMLKVFNKNKVKSYDGEEICVFNVGGVSTSGKNTLLSVRELYSIYTKYGGKWSFDFLKMLLRPFWYLIKGR